MAKLKKIFQRKIAGKLVTVTIEDFPKGMEIKESKKTRLLPLDSVLISYYGLSYTHSDETKALIDEYLSLVRKVILANTKGEKLPSSDYERLDEIREKYEPQFYTCQDALYQDFRDLMEEERCMYLYSKPEIMTDDEKRERKEKAKKIFEKLKQKRYERK